MSFFTFLVFQTCMTFFSSAEHKKYILKNVANQTVLAPIDLHCMDKKHGDISKWSQVWNDMSKRWQHLWGWSTIVLKSVLFWVLRRLVLVRIWSAFYSSSLWTWACFLRSLINIPPHQSRVQDISAIERFKTQIVSIHQKLWEKKTEG